jgi:hypothetical protein
MGQLKKYSWIIFIFFLASSCQEGELLGPKSENPHLLLSIGSTVVEDDIDSSFVKLPEVSLGTTAKRTFTIKNQGGGDLNISEITVDNNLFVVTQPELTLLKPKESTTFVVSFTPQRFGERIAHIGFMTNDQENPAFLFKVIGSSVRELSIAYNDTETPEGINTASVATGVGTKFITSMELFDPFEELDEQTDLVISAVFSNGDRASLVKTGAKTGFYVNNSLTNIRFTFSIAFGLAEYVDMEVFIRLANGKTTSVQKYRINRPDGAL